MNSQCTLEAEARKPSDSTTKEEGEEREGEWGISGNPSVSVRSGRGRNERTGGRQIVSARSAVRQVRLGPREAVSREPHYDFTEDALL